MKLITLFIALVVAIMAPIAILASCDANSMCVTIENPRPALYNLLDIFFYNVFSNGYFAVYLLATFFAFLSIAYLFFKKEIVHLKTFMVPMAMIFAGYTAALAATIYSVRRIRFAIDQFNFWKYVNFSYSGRLSLFWPVVGLVVILLAEFLVLKLQFNEMAKMGIIKSKAGNYKIILLMFVGLAAVLALWICLFLIFKTIGIYDVKISD